MGNYNRVSPVSDEDRRAFLKALGVSGAVAAGSTTLSEVRRAMETSSTSELASIGESLRNDVTGLDANQLATHQQGFTAAAASLIEASERGIPTGDAPRDEFRQVAAAGEPIFEHLDNTGFFENTTKKLPEFSSDFLHKASRAFVGMASVTSAFDDVGFAEGEAADLVATVVSNAEYISDYHWVATDELPREEMEIGEFIPTMTKATAYGGIRWLHAVDEHLWKFKPLITQNILTDAVWHSQSVAAGFHLMSEGARIIGANDASVSDEALAALLSTGFALQAISQNRLWQSVFLIEEGQRGERQSIDVKNIHYSGGA